MKKHSFAHGNFSVRIAWRKETGTAGPDSTYQTFFGAKFWLKDRADAEIVALQAPRSAFEPADLLQKLARSMREEPQLRKASNRDRKASLVDRFP